MARVRASEGEGQDMSDIDKKVRGVLSRVFRDLPVFGGPLG